MQDAKKMRPAEIVLDILQRGRLVIIVVFALVVGAVVALVIKNQVDQRLKTDLVTSLENLDEAYNTWKSAVGDKPKADALDNLQKETAKIASGYPGSYNLQRAHHLLATIAFEAGQFDKAETEYIQAFESKKDSFFAGECLFNAAIAAEQANHLDKSQEYLNRLIKDYRSTTADAPRAYLALGHIAEKNNDFPKAGDYYKQLVDAYGNDSDWTKVARDRIIFLKTQQKL